jgi:hypothetical protein
MRTSGTFAVPATVAALTVWFRGAPVLAQAPTAQEQTSGAVFLRDGRLKQGGNAAHLCYGDSATRRLCFQIDAF